MRLLFGLLLVFTLLVLPSQTQEQPKADINKLAQKVFELEREIRTIKMTIEAYHELQQYRPPDNVSELFARMRRTLKACGCPLVDEEE